MAEKGLNYLVKIGGTAVGAQRNATLNFTMTPIDVTTKQSPSGAREYEPGLKQWTIQADGLYVPTDTAQAALKSALENGTSVAVDLTTGTVGEYHFEWGTAYLSALNDRHEDEGVGTVETTIECDGDPTFTEVV